MEGVEEVKEDSLQVNQWGHGSSLFEQPPGLTSVVVFFIQYVYIDEDLNIHFERVWSLEVYLSFK